MSADEGKAEVHIKLDNLTEQEWIGFGAAVEWICMRGKPMPLHQYESRLDEAAAILASELYKCGEVESEQTVKGVANDDPDGFQKSIPHFVWKNVVVHEDEYDLQRWNLALVGRNDEWGAELIGPTRRYLDLQIKSGFILRRWRPATLELDPMRIGGGKNSSAGRTKKSADGDLLLFAVAVFRQLPGHLSPLRQQEFEELVKARFPDCTRTKSRDFFTKYKPKNWTTKRGPRGPQDTDRARRLDEFRQKMISAELRN